VFRNRPKRGKKWGSLAWHLSTNYFIKGAARGLPPLRAIEVDRLQPKPVVKITGEFYLQTVEGDPNYNIHRWLESEGAEVYPAPIAVWLDYLIRVAAQSSRTTSASTAAPAPSSRCAALQRVYRWNYDRLRRALGDMPHEMPDQYELRARRALFPPLAVGRRRRHADRQGAVAHHHKKAHMICELSPYACMPNTMSIGAMAG
jgi:predicted nucleotide-binding protein (sugar kinase/HSP70/actin superfamily)